MPPKDTLGNRIRVVRERLGITQVDLAREVGISRQALISVEKGRMNPSVVVSLKMARILREPVDYLFFIDGRAGEAPEPDEKAAKAPKAKGSKAPDGAPVPAPTPEPEPEPVPEPAPEPEPEPEPVAAEPVAAESAEPAEPQVAAAATPDPESAPSASPARHAVPVSSEPEAPTTGEPGDGDEPDDAQLSLFE